MSKKRIGILTSGGDCSGLNSAIRAVTHRAIHLGWEVYGIHNGTSGFLSAPMEYEQLLPDSKIDLFSKEGGSFLGSINKGDPFAYPMPDGSKIDRVDEIIDGAKKLGLSAIITVGGDGSMDIVGRICKRGNLDFIGIPKTIDGDVPLTESMIGFDTAIHMVVEGIDAIRSTARSHSRVIVVETMGRGAGHLALNGGLSAGADVILLPEIPYDFNKVLTRLKEIKRFRDYAIVVTAEAACEIEGSQTVGIINEDGREIFSGVSHKIAKQIQQQIGWETRSQILGHTQRGGKPTAIDRMLGSLFGVAAVDLLELGKTNRMVCMRNGKLSDVGLDDVLGHSYPSVDIENNIYFHTAKKMGICFGN